jgi:arylsulfatase A-like enzyme
MKPSPPTPFARRALLAATAFAWLISTLGTTPATAQTRPNVLFLFADDMRADTIAAHGNDRIRTPHLDGLVKAGFSFRRNYTFGGNSGAVCVPSRAMLMTGKTWFDLDVGTLHGEKLLPELLGENGYATFATGKWHNGPASFARGFQQGKSVMFGGMSDHTKVPLRDLNLDRSFSPERVGKKPSSELFADSAIEFLKSRETNDEPFFCYVAFTAPHDPRQPPPGYAEPYYKDPPPLPKNFLPQHPFDNGMMQGGRDEDLAPWPRSPETIRDQLAEYYGLITHLDEQIGRVLGALDEAGKADNTIVIFSADNGLALGSHGLLGKQSVYEHSMQTPLIVRGPGVPQGASSPAFTYLYDLFPTLCDVLSVEASHKFAGASLRPIWEGRQASIRDSVFLPFLGIQRAIRDERWKLIAYPQIGHLQFFDLQNDPNEITNLIDDPTAKKELPRLQKKMDEWQAKVGDRLKVPLASRPAPPIDLTGRPREPDPWQPPWILEKYFGLKQ